MDFPSWPPEAKPARSANTCRARRLAGRELCRARRQSGGILTAAEEVAALRPDFATMRRGSRAPMRSRRHPGATASISSRGNFAPNYGVDEDPVTGSAHCVLTPYWAARLGKEQPDGTEDLGARRRTHLHLRGDRVTIAAMRCSISKARSPYSGGKGTAMAEHFNELGQPIGFPYLIGRRAAPAAAAQWKAVSALSSGWTRRATPPTSTRPIRSTGMGRNWTYLP